MRPLILIGSTDTDYYMVIEHILDVEGFETVFARSLDEIIHFATEYRPYAILLDCGAGSSAAAVACVKLKNDTLTSGISTIALISPGAESQYAELIKAGIDENFVRPVAPAKLIEFLQTRARGSRNFFRKATAELTLSYADIVLNVETRRVSRNGKDIHLAPTEFRLLQHLMSNAEQVCGRTELVANAWPVNIHVEPRTVNVHIGRLRKALRSANSSNLIRTVRSAGYALDASSDS